MKTFFRTILPAIVLMLTILLAINLIAFPIGTYTGVFLGASIVGLIAYFIWSMTDYT